MTHEEYVKAREQLIGEATRLVDEARPKEIRDLADWHAHTGWTRLFADTMQRLAYREGLISYDPDDARLVEAKARRAAGILRPVS